MSISPELSEVVDFLKAHAPFDRLRPALLEGPNMQGADLMGALLPRDFQFLLLEDTGQ